MRKGGLGFELYESSRRCKNVRYHISDAGRRIGRRIGRETGLGIMDGDAKVSKWAMGRNESRASK
jgi:hypothetical protein